MARKGPRASIIIRAPNGDVREVPLSESPVVIGRDESADIRVEDRKVSRRHAAFRLADGEVWAEDLDSINGITVNGERVDKRVAMKRGDVVNVGGYEVSLKSGPSPSKGSLSDIAAPTAAVAPAYGTVTEHKSARPSLPPGPVLIGIDGPVKGKRFALQPGDNIVGRQAGSAVTVSDSSVSRQHARLSYGVDQLVLLDLKSQNGVFVQNRRVTKEVLSDGDQIRIGGVSFRVELPRGMRGRDREPRMAELGGPPSKKGGAKKKDSTPIAVVALVLVVIAVVTAGVLTGRVDLGPLKGLLAGVGGSSTEGIADSGALDALGEIAVGADASSTAVVAAGGGDASPPVVEAPDAGAGVQVALTQTATSPYSRRDENGWPLNLPSVDPSFDFDGFIAAKLQEAKDLEAKGQLEDVELLISMVLGADPINAEALGVRERIDSAKGHAKTLQSAEKLRSDGKLLEALELFHSIPEEAPQHSAALEAENALKPVVFEEQLGRALSEAKEKRTLERAHARVVRLLALDPAHAAALDAVKKIERAMSRAGVSFEPYRPPDSGPVPPDDTTSPEAKIEEMHGSERLARLARLYSRGDDERAIRSASKVMKSSKASEEEKAGAKRLKSAIIEAQKRRAKVRAALGGEPREAWSVLLSLRAAETKILPKGVKPPSTIQLEHSIAEEFAKRGAKAMGLGQTENAFQQWDSGHKLDPDNPTIKEGLAQLIKMAEELLEKSAILSQRGGGDPCEGWRQITRITQSTAEVHQKAKKELERGCR